MMPFRIAAVSVALMCTIACGNDSSSPVTAPTPSPSPVPTPPLPAPAPAAPPSVVSIPVGAASMGTGAFRPDDLNIAVGTTVTWTNNDSVSHTSTSDAAGWDSGIVAPGGQFSLAFQAQGTFRYHCAIHPGMVGTVIVQ